MAKIIGIDLGTTNSEAGYMEGGTPKIVPSAEGSAYGGEKFPAGGGLLQDGVLVGGPGKGQPGVKPGKNDKQKNTKVGAEHQDRNDRQEDTTPEKIATIE